MKGQEQQGDPDDQPSCSCPFFKRQKDAYTILPAIYCIITFRDFFFELDGYASSSSFAVENRPAGTEKICGFRYPLYLPGTAPESDE